MLVAVTVHAEVPTLGILSALLRVTTCPFHNCLPRSVGASAGLANSKLNIRCVAHLDIYINVNICICTYIYAYVNIYVYIHICCNLSSLLFF